MDFSNCILMILCITSSWIYTDILIYWYIYIRIHLIYTCIQMHYTQYTRTHIFLSLEVVFHMYIILIVDLYCFYVLTEPHPIK